MDIISLGEILIDMFPVEIGRKIADVSAFYPKPGGACANVAVAVARLGKKSAFIGKVGEDAFGYSLINTLKQNGVETRGMRVDEKNRTSLVFIAMPDENSAEFIFYRNPGADLCLKTEELDLSLFDGAKAFHCGSLSLVDEPARSAQFSAVEVAQKNGAIISFDVNHRPILWNDKKNALKQISKMISLTDILKVNENELVLLTGLSDPLEGGAQLIHRGVKLVAITLGVKGSYYYSPKYKGYVPPFPIKTVDAIGCGDAFIAGLLSFLVNVSDKNININEKVLLESFTYANAVGAITALTRGVIPALPTSDQVREFLKTHKN
jgi:fructokinase